MATSIEEHKVTYKNHTLIHISEFIETMREIDISETVSTEDSEGNYLEAPFTETMKAKERIKIGEKFKKETKRNLTQLANMNIVVITTANSKGFEDFTSTFTTPVTKIIIQDLVKSINDKDYRATKEGSGIIKTINKADIVCFVRGGGDLTHPSFNYYRNAGLIPTIKKINPDCTVITAIGHASDVFLADLYADVSVITPTAAAITLRDALTMSNHFIGHTTSHYTMAFTDEEREENLRLLKEELLKVDYAADFKEMGCDLHITHGKNYSFVFNVVKDNRLVTAINMGPLSYAKTNTKNGKESTIYIDYKKENLEEQLRTNSRLLPMEVRMELDIVRYFLKHEPFETNPLYTEQEKLIHKMNRLNEKNNEPVKSNVIPFEKPVEAVEELDHEIVEHDDSVTEISEFWELGGKILSFEIKGVREVGVSVMVNYTATTRAKAFKDNEFGFFYNPIKQVITDDKQHP
ncbi:hypothetical protein L1887_51146 [Cichorium endivia]|nr:hypothetical protein L1887_51146 [Cichorium endivia]